MSLNKPARRYRGTEGNLTCAIVRSDSGVIEVLLRSRATREDFCSVNSLRTFLSDSNAEESLTSPTGQPRYGSNSKAMWQPASERRRRRGVHPVSRLKVTSERYRRSDRSSSSSPDRADRTCNRKMEFELNLEPQVEKL